MSTRIKLTIFVLFLLTATKFIPFILHGLVPIPFDLLVGAYFPWLDDKWGYVVGVPIKNSIVTDVISQLYPWLHLARQQVLSGFLPLWNPTSLLGYPYYANYHSSIFYPTNILLLLGPLAISRTVQLFLQQFLTLAFMFLFLTELRFSFLASLFGAFIFASTGLMMTDFEFASGSKALTFLPLSLWFILKNQKKLRTRNLIGLALSYTFLLLAGHFQVTVYASIIIIFSIFWFNRHSFQNLLPYLFALFLGAGLASFQLLPTIELLTQSIRVTDDYITQVNYGILPLRHLLTIFLAPDLYGNPSTQNYYGFWNYRETIGYIGLIPAVLVAITLSNHKYRPIKYIFVATLFFIFIPPIANLPYKLHLPLLNTAAASRLFFPLAFFAGILGAHSLNELVQRKFSLKGLYFFWFIYLSTVSYYLARFTAYKTSPFFSYVTHDYLSSYTTVRNLIIPTFLLIITTFIIFTWHHFHSKLVLRLSLFTLLTLTVFDLLRFHYKFNPFVNPKLDFPSTPITTFLQSHPGRIIQPSSEVLPANTWTTYGIQSFLGYDPLYPTKNGLYFAAINSNQPRLDHNPGRYLDRMENFNSPLIDLAAGKYLVAIKQDSAGFFSNQGKVDYRIPLDKYHKVFESGSVAILKNDNALPFAYLSTSPQVVQSDQEALTKLIENKIYYPAYTTSSLTQKYNDDSKITPLDINPSLSGGVELDLKTEQPSILVLSQPYYPGWVARINQQKIKIHPFNYLFIGVEVPPGVHRFTLSFEPPTFYLGIFLAFMSALIMIVWLYQSNRYEKK